MDTPIIDHQLHDIAKHVAPFSYRQLGAKLGLGPQELGKILDTNTSNYLKSTEAILTIWWAAEPEVSLKTKKIRLEAIFSSLGIKIDAFLPAVEQQEQELSSMNNLEADLAVSSLRSIDSRTSSSLQRNEDARRTVESTQSSVPPYQGSNSATSGSSQGQPKFYDIYLQFSQDTVHVDKVKDIIRRNRWMMMTVDDNKLGVPKIISIEEALRTCSHVVLIITQKDCEKDDTYQTMTRGMAFQSTVGKTLNGRVLSIRCCEESHLPLALQTLENASIDDPYLEDKLKNTIDVRIRQEKEGSLVGTSSTLPTVSSDPGIKPLQDAAEVEGICSQMNNLFAGPSSSVNGNV